MKALVTAGGHGTRLRPITHTKNKHLIPIANRPMLAHALEYIKEAGMSEVGVIVNSGDKEIENVFKDGKEYGLHLTYIPQEMPLGLAHAVKIAEPFIGKEDFVFYLGDNILVGGIKQFIREFEERGSNCHLVLSEVPDPYRFGVPEIVGDKIIRVEEKPQNPKSKFAVTGIYLYDHTIFEAVKAIQPSARGELEISDAHQYLIDHGEKVSFSKITGWWKDTGKVSDILEANRLVLENMESRQEGIVSEDSSLLGKISVGKNSRVMRSTIRGPVILGSGVHVHDSYIGPYTSIGDGCQIIGSELEYSIIMSDSIVKSIGTRIESSLLGHGVEIIGSNSKPKTHRFMLGDQSQIELS